MMKYNEKKRAQKKPEPMVTQLDSKEFKDSIFQDEEQELMLQKIRRQIGKKHKARKDTGKGKK